MSLKYSLLLYLTFSSLLPLTSMAKTLDSLRTEKIKGTKFVVHRVDPKETLYSISKRYGASIDEIYEYNESIESGLKMYDELYIPLTKKNKRKTKVNAQKAILVEEKNMHIVMQGETLYSISQKYNFTVDSLMGLNQLKSNQLSLGDTLFIVSKQVKPERKEKSNEKLPVIKKKGIIHHEVAPSETLFGISKIYNVSIDQLTKWNAMDSYNLEIGQQLVVSYLDSTAATLPIKEFVVTKQDSLIEDTTLDTLYVKTDNSLLRQQKTIEGKLEIIEEGFAMKIEDTDFTKKLLALHKTAPMGSLVTIKNQMTGKKVQVRVVGTLPESGINQNVLLRLSTAAFNQLGALNMKVPITSSYVKK